MKLQLDLQLVFFLLKLELNMGLKTPPFFCAFITVFSSLSFFT
jgi:hypothetical protein